MSTLWKLSLAILAVALLTAVPAAIEGSYMRRWGVGADLQTAGRNVEATAKALGDWVFEKEGEPLADLAVSDLGIEGYTNRVYRHRTTGRTVTLLLMVGKPGPLVRHPPHICYTNLNNRQVGRDDMLAVGGPPASQFRLLHFERGSRMLTQRFMVAYSHSADGVWSAPDWPRLHFGGEPLLYKVQVLTGEEAKSDRKDREALVDFLEAFVASFSRQIAVK